ncbi:MAG: hypothetical protein K8U57_20890 [Planctomycetes bacterium]|nr:hypothetical protein [Planctomycetota bacterium]
MPQSSTWPTEAETCRMATDLVSGVATAPGEIFSAFLNPVTHYLERRSRFADPEQCETAAADAIFAVVKRPSRYDPNRLELDAFLRMVARRKMASLFAKDNQHPKIISLEFVAEPVAHGNHSPNDSPSWDDPRLVAEVAAFDPTESAVLELMRCGNRSSAAFATIPGLADVSPNELATLAKQWKDRIKKRLTRAVGGAK